jgi:hypothetical protein
MNALTPLLLMFVGSGLLLIGISIPLIQRRAKPNEWLPRCVTINSSSNQLLAGEVC